MDVAEWVMLVVYAALVVVVAMAFLFGPIDRAPAHLHDPPRPELTPVDKPTLNPRNGPFVSVLYGLAGELSKTPDALKDLARTIQLHEVNPVSDVTRERVARVLDEHAGIVKRGAQEVREAET